MSREAARRELRATRDALGGPTRQRFSVAIARQLERCLPAGARRVAAYNAVRSEPDLAPAMLGLRRRGAILYLPRIDDTRHHTMVFARAMGRLRPNRYGISEPADFLPRIDARDLDVVLVPLVGADDRGVRLGMGGGYYDRAFAFLRQGAARQGPLLIGVAFECQRVARLPSAAHDVRLDALVTERRFLWFKKGFPCPGS